jgi:hypothetical protein
MGGGGPSYVTRVTSVTPTEVQASAFSDGSGITVTNTGDEPLVIEGYRQEPFVRIDATGVWENMKSPTVFLDEATAAVPPGTDPRATPVWEQIGTTRQYTWHDDRIHGPDDARPSAVQADPGHAHLIATWTIPLRYGAERGAITGTLTYVPQTQISKVVNVLVIWGPLVLLGVLVAAFVIARRRGRGHAGERRTG